MVKNIEQEFIDKKIDDLRGMIESEISNLNPDILDLTKIYKKENQRSIKDINLNYEIRKYISIFISNKISDYLNENLSKTLEPLIKEYLGSKKLSLKQEKDEKKLDTSKNSPKKITLFKRKRKQINSISPTNSILLDDLNKMTKMELINYGIDKKIKLNIKMKKDKLISQILKI